MSGNYGISKDTASKIVFFEDMTEYKLIIISEYLNLVKFKPYEYVFKESAPYGSAYFLIEGSVQVLKQVEEKVQPKVLAEISRPQMFGELALISRGNRSASVLSLEPLTLAELSIENFEKLIQYHPELAVNIIRKIAVVISNRLRISNENFVYLSTELESCL